VDIGDAAQRLEQAAHDTRVVLDCIALGDLNHAHSHAISARTDFDAA
jgi:hypothetical protein